MSEQRSSRHAARRTVTVVAFTVATAVALVAPTWLALHDRDTTTVVSEAALAPASSAAAPASSAPVSSAPVSSAPASSAPPVVAPLQSAVRAATPTTSPLEESASAPLLTAISPTGTAATLATDHWSTLPAAPIAARSDAAVAWTGRQMLIWGGDSGVQHTHLNADGAAYDPTSKTWTTLPASPISARAAVASVWTGTEFFVWGGFTTMGPAATAVADGALYNPTTRQWRELPAAPIGARASARAVLLDGVVYVIGGSTASGQPCTSAAAYDVATHSWKRLPAPPKVADHEVGSVVATAVGDGLDVWQLWSHATPVPPNGETIGSGIDALYYDPTTHAWRAGVPIDASTSDGPDGIQEAIWTGQRILLPTSSIWCGGCAGPPNPHPHGYQWLPDSQTWTAIPQSPVDEGVASYLWTGSALLGYDSSSPAGGAAAWEPATNSWTTLPAAPLYGSSIAAVWTGSQLLEWGSMYDPAAALSDGAPVEHDAGLSLGP